MGGVVCRWNAGIHHDAIGNEDVLVIHHVGRTSLKGGMEWKFA